MVQDLATLEGTTKMTETDHAHPFAQISAIFGQSQGPFLKKRRQTKDQENLNQKRSHW